MRKKTKGTLVAAAALALVGAGVGLRLWANNKPNQMPMLWAVLIGDAGSDPRNSLA
ncbi:MAG: hypothetical protein ACREHG_06105 [Candidatus Saccharimonadales bacterium]